MNQDPGRPLQPDAARWRRARALFEQAVDLQAGARTAWVTEQCAADEDLARQVLELLRADDPAHDSPARQVLASPAPIADAVAAAGAPDFALFDPAAHIGQRIGEFTLLSVLGQGGMGVVYLARQEQPRRQVALKMLRGGMHSGDSIRRFTYEAEVLARLQHPGIAQVFASGSVTIGSILQPFIAMELVDGARRLDAWLRECRQPLERRLEVFLAICLAVQHGHRQGFLHRDLKPGNILIDASGRPKVIDFGIARAIGGEQPDVAAVRTTTGEWLGTLAYMSPEQVDGDELDVRSDVHALGLVLFELLTGVRAVACDDLGPAAAFDRIRAGPRARPSAIAPAGMLPANAVELDWIVARATATDRERRYASVDELVADVRRFLAHEPIHAGPPSAWYRMRKLVRRHRVAAAASVAVVLSLGAGAIAAVSGFGQALAAERLAVARQQRAEREAVRAARINRFLTGMLQSVHPERDGREVRVVELLAAAGGELDGADGHAIDAHDESVLRSTLGHTLAALDQVGDATVHLERAAELAQQHLGDDDPQRWTSLQNLGVLRLKQGRLPEAAELQHAALAGRLRLLGETHLDVASSRANLAALLQRQGDLPAAIEQMARAHRIYGEVLGLHHRDTLRAQASLAGLLAAAGRAAEALPLALDANEGARTRLGLRHPVALHTSATLALLQHDAGDLAGAAASLRSVLSIRQEVLGPRHQATLTTAVNLAKIHSDLGELAEAEQLLGAVVAALQQDGKLDGAFGLQARHNLAAVLQRQHRLEEALVLHDEVAAGAARRIPAAHWLQAAFAKERGVTLGRLGRHDEARAELERAVAIFVASVGADDDRTGRARAALAELPTKAASTGEPSLGDR